MTGDPNDNVAGPAIQLQNVFVKKLVMWRKFFGGNWKVYCWLKKRAPLRKRTHKSDAFRMKKVWAQNTLTRLATGLDDVIYPLDSHSIQSLNYLEKVGCRVGC